MKYYLVAKGLLSLVEACNNSLFCTIISPGIGLRVFGRKNNEFDREMNACVARASLYCVFLCRKMETILDPRSKAFNKSRML